MKILALVLAGGEGTRLYPLTAEHSKPAVPFVNGYRIVDFVLSNLVNSGVNEIYVLAQYKPDSLLRHVEKVWSGALRPRKGFIRTLLPRPNGGEAYFRGTSDAVYQNLDLIHIHKPDLVAVFAADHVYRMDVGQMVGFHNSVNADVTVAAVPVPVEKAGAFGIIEAGPAGEIRQFQEKPRFACSIPDDPSHAYASMGNYLFNPDVLVGLLQAASLTGGTDFGRDILPRLPGRCRIYAYNFGKNYVPGVQAHEEHAYWRDVGTLDALSAAQSDILGAAPLFDLSNPHWPIRGEHPHPARPRTAQPTRPSVSPVQMDIGAMAENRPLQQVGLASS